MSSGRLSELYSTVDDEVEVENRGDTTIIQVLETEVQLMNVSELKRIFKRETDKGPNNLIVDMSKVNYIDSAGIGLVISLHKTMTAAQGNYCLTGINDQVAKILSMAHVQKIISTYSSVDEAVYNLVK